MIRAVTVRLLPKLAILLACLYPIALAAPPTLDPDIVNMIGQIDPNRVAANIQTLVGFGTRNSCSDNSGASPGIGAARDWIRSQFAALPGVQVRLDPFAGCQPLQNVIAWIPGSGHPDRLIVIGGHYDSRTYSVTDGTSPAPGANDGGSQTALVLEAARVMAGHTFDATVVFAAWAGEEQGLFGSGSFVQNYTSYFPTGTLELNLNCDIVGGDNVANNATALQQFRLFSTGTPPEITYDGTTDNTSPSRNLMRHVGYWGGTYAPEMTMLPQLREDRPGRTGDHVSFINSGIPAVLFIDANELPDEPGDHQHSPYDLFGYVTPAFTSRVTEVVVATAANLARAPTPPQSMTVTVLSANTIRLNWAPPASGPAVDHYVISARPTTENFYHTRFVVPGSANTADARLIEDLGMPAGTAYFVSVAAVDAAGHESLYASPESRNTALVSLLVTPASPSIARGTTQQFIATGTFSDGSTQNLTNSAIWTSANTAVATINSAGLATGVAAGNTTIQATAGSISGSTSLTVTSAVLVSLAVTPANPSIARGTTQQFTATGTFNDGTTQNLTNSAIWTSTNTAVATITSTGLATGAAAGNTTIQAASGSVTGSTSLAVTAVVGLVAAYSCDQGSGTTLADNSGHGNIGNLNGATWTTAGKYNGALSFDGNTARVDIPDTPSLNTSLAFTVEFWYKANANANSMIAKPVGPGWFDTWQFEFTGGALSFTSSDGNSQRWDTTPAPSVGTWHHVAGTWDGTTKRLYVDGVLMVTATAAIAFDTLNVVIGGDYNSGTFVLPFSGTVDEVRIYNRALSQAEIQTDMATPIS